MADTRRGCLQAEEWVRVNGFPVHFPGRSFFKRLVPLRDGGTFQFDAVADDESVFGLISTSGYKTVRGNDNTGAIRKIESDLLMFERFDRDGGPEAKLVLAFTELTMADGFIRKQNRGRVRKDILILHVPLPPEVQLLVEADRAASRREQGAPEQPELNHEVLRQALGSSYDRLVMKKK